MQSVTTAAMPNKRPLQSQYQTTHGNEQTAAMTTIEAAAAAGGEQSYRGAAPDSGRGSKSQSPRTAANTGKQAVTQSAATMKGSGVVSVIAPANINNMEDLRAKYNQMCEENKVLKREI